jgi:16S rRNA (cytidine1402-2'-O)-methyltransferase
MLYLVGTPIGNLEDLTLRAIRILREVDTIFVENKSDSLRLINHIKESYGEISADLFVYNDSNKDKKEQQARDYLAKGNIAFISSAGMPSISDPGSSLVQIAEELEIEHTVIPGPSAPFTAFALSGLQKKHINFVGFLPKKPGKIFKLLDAYLTKDSAIVAFDSPYRIAKDLEKLTEYDKDLYVVVTKELTKMFESKWQGTPAELVAMIEAGEVNTKGEFTIIICQK